MVGIICQWQMISKIRLQLTLSTEGIFRKQLCLVGALVPI